MVSYIFMLYLFICLFDQTKDCMSKSAHGLTGMYLHFTATATSLYLFTHYSDCRISTSPVYQFNIKTCEISQNRNPHVFHYCITDFALWNCNLILSLNDGTRAGFLPDNFSLFFFFVLFYIVAILSSLKHCIDQLIISNLFFSHSLLYSSYFKAPTFSMCWILPLAEWFLFKILSCGCYNCINVFSCVPRDTLLFQFMSEVMVFPGTCSSI